MSRFYDWKEIYPFLQEIVKSEIVMEELKNSDWYEWPEKYLYNEKGYDWKVCPFFAFGIWRKDAEHQEKFKNTIAMLKQIPGLKTALFSRLGAGTKLTPHRGWASLANHVLRCHLGLVVPEDGRSGVQVEDEFRQIHQNDWLVFDDSKIHLGLNEGTTDKIILLIDIERPPYIPKGESTVENTDQLNDFVAKFS